MAALQSSGFREGTSTNLFPRIVRQRESTAGDSTKRGSRDLFSRSSSIPPASRGNEDDRIRAVCVILNHGRAGHVPVLCLRKEAVMTLKVLIKSHERGLMFRKGTFVRVLGPGEYTLWSRLFSAKAVDVQVFSTLETYIRHPLLEAFATRPAFQEEAMVLSLTDVQRALIWRDERLAYILGPGRHALWKMPYTLRVEMFDISTLRFTHERLATVMKHPESAGYFEGVQVPAHEVVLMSRDGVLLEQLREGLHVFWKGTGKLSFKSVDLREQVADVAGQEIMTSDKVALRVNLLVNYQVTDPEQAATITADYQQAALPRGAACPASGDWRKDA